MPYSSRRRLTLFMLVRYSGHSDMLVDTLRTQGCLMSITE